MALGTEHYFPWGYRDQEKIVCMRKSAPEVHPKKLSAETTLVMRVISKKSAQSEEEKICKCRQSVVEKSSCLLEIMIPPPGKNMMVRPLKYSASKGKIIFDHH